MVVILTFILDAIVRRFRLLFGGRSLIEFTMSSGRYTMGRPLFFNGETAVRRLPVDSYFLRVHLQMRSTVDLSLSNFLAVPAIFPWAKTGFPSSHLQPTRSIVTISLHSSEVNMGRFFLLLMVLTDQKLCKRI